MPYIDKEKARLYKQKWNKDFYQKNRKAEMARVAKRKEELRGWLDTYKTSLACELCGENHPACLDFHQLEAGQKLLHCRYRNNQDSKTEFCHSESDINS